MLLLYGETTPLHFETLLFPKDYTVTFEDELNFVWRVAPRFSMAKLLFFAVGGVTVEWWTTLIHISEPLLIHNQLYPSFLFL